MRIHTRTGIERYINMSKSKYFDFRNLFMVEYDRPQDDSPSTIYFTDFDSVDRLTGGQFDLMTRITNYIPICDKGIEDDIQPDDFKEMGEIFLNPEKVIGIQRLTELKQSLDVARYMRGEI